MAIFQNGEVLQALASIVLLLVSWLLSLAISKWGKAEAVKTILETLQTEIHAVFHEDIEPRLAAARAENSPGGATVTADERKELLGALWTGVRNRLSGKPLKVLEGLGVDWLKTQGSIVFAGLLKKLGITV